MGHLFIGVLMAAGWLHAMPLISPFDAIKQSYGHNGVHISKKNLLLTNKEALAVSALAKVRMTSKIYRIFKVSDANGIHAFGVLITKKVRSKNAAVLYLIEHDTGMLKSIEIVAFNEPSEYIPSKRWLQQFDGKKSGDVLRVGTNIPTITGATMSARTLTDGARLALAIYEIVLRGKP